MNNPYTLKYLNKVFKTPRFKKFLVELDKAYKEGQEEWHKHEMTGLEQKEDQRK
jgi:hypothetical protein